MSNVYHTLFSIRCCRSGFRQFIQNIVEEGEGIIFIAGRKWDRDSRWRRPPAEEKKTCRIETKEKGGALAYSELIFDPWWGPGWIDVEAKRRQNKRRKTINAWIFDGNWECGSNQTNWGRPGRKSILRCTGPRVFGSPLPGREIKTPCGEQWIFKGDWICPFPSFLFDSWKICKFVCMLSVFDLHRLWSEGRKVTRDGIQGRANILLLSSSQTGDQGKGGETAPKEGKES